MRLWAHIEKIDECSSWEKISRGIESKSTYYLRHSVVSNKLKRYGRFLRKKYFFRDPGECAQLLIVELHFFIIRSETSSRKISVRIMKFFVEKWKQIKLNRALWFHERKGIIFAEIFFWIEKLCVVIIWFLEWCEPKIYFSSCQCPRELWDLMRRRDKQPSRKEILTFLISSLSN